MKLNSFTRLACTALSAATLCVASNCVLPNNTTRAAEPNTADEAVAAGEPVIRNGDRVALVGAGWVERMQEHEWLETILTSQQPNVTFRNVGWAGDTVFGDARAVFGSQQDGFARLCRDIEQAQPTVAILCYGENEAQKGEAELAKFVANYERLLTKLSELKCRSVLLIPRKREAGHADAPASDRFNKSFHQYAEAIRTLASKNNLGLVDLENFKANEKLTRDGIYWTEQGYIAASIEVANQLGYKLAAPKFSIDWKTKTIAFESTATGKLTELQINAKSAEKAIDVQLKSASGLVPIPFATIELKNAPSEKSEVVVIVDGKEYKPGDQVPVFAGQLRNLQVEIAKKNQWFFHRFRPQNETYLFLFRKHEQGNNAVEVEQMLPHVESLEKSIQTLRQSGTESKFSIVEKA